MAHAWDQTITITQDLAKQLIEQQTPLKVFSLEILGQGFDNSAYLVNKEFVFRFPRRQLGVQNLENEISVLPYIATKVTFPFSCPYYIGKPSDMYPAPFAGYKIVPGTVLSNTQAKFISDENFTRTLAAWIKQLHCVPVLTNHAIDLKDTFKRYEINETLEKAQARILHYEPHFIAAGFNKNDLGIIAKKLSDLNYSSLEKSVYVHGDLYSRHLLIDSQKKLSGIIDFGDIHIGNPAIDLSVISSQPVYDPVSQIVYATTRNQVSDVWVNGKHLLAKYRLTAMDEAKLRDKAIEWHDKISATDLKSG
jgi:aminoglycoside phosphotransferase (APT) family kinase protein